MRWPARAALLALVATLGAYGPASAQVIAPPPPPPPNLPAPPPPAVRHPLPPLGIYAVASIGCAAVSPMIGTIILGRELTLNEAYRSTLGCFLGPVGWLLADLLVPQAIVPPPPPPGLAPLPPPRPQLRVSRASHVSLPPRGETHFVTNEILVEVDANAAARFAALARRLRLTRLETQTFALTGRTLQRWRIDSGRPVRATLAALGSTVTDAQANYLYGLPQLQAGASDAGAQYVVPKLRLTEAHRISNGDDVVVAVIDSKIDAKHPDLAGVVTEEDDVLATGGPAHMHGTAMAGAIAAHSKLVGVAPKVRLLAVRVFSGPEDSAQGSTFDILKGLDWAASRNARIVNMSFAGPSDPLLREMIGKAHARGMVLIAAVGNAGPRSPPLFPAAYPGVIGVTATDADDKLLPQANRGPQVAVAAPGVGILAAAPDAKYQITSGTSVAAAHVTGIAALMLAQDPTLKPDDVRKRLVGSVRAIPGARRDVGAGVVDALTAVSATAKVK